MPLYDYVCTSCDHELEALQNFNEPPLKTCPVCHKDTLKKKIAAPAFTFKGGGWYKDLYGSSSTASSPDNHTSAKSTNSASPEKKSNSKPGKSTAGSAST
jgi:putative FmdB family regulatory protein